MAFTYIRHNGFVVSSCCIAVLLTTGAAAVAQMTRADPIRGRELAERLCTNCHVVVPGNDLTITKSGPDFRAIANSPNQTPERIAGAMIIPHPDMPTVALTMQEMRDMTAYIASLKTTP